MATPTTYLDLMALATALTESSKLEADSEAWSRAWFHALELPEARDLLPQVGFAVRDPYPPLSDQVEALKRSLSRAGIISLHNPRYRYYTMEQRDKDLVREENHEALERHRDVLLKIAAVLDDELSAAAQSR
jgi:hypothetical protein